ncbi:MAG: peptidoglycan DD-metalloendopeptidase family protein [Pseudomonadales bacterium]|nr:peptidoglycan DD-metalloendopeptidase family protein [Pseudomonadales bacterium]NRA14420.1 peptidoglycan DD-metalloendopeptidase family protein [Oceanospirillaceae bacterium]
MKTNMVITLTTGSGSKQFSMSKIARYVTLAILTVVICYLVASNWLLVRTSTDLIELEQNHRYLNGQYTTLLGTQQRYKKELSQLSDVFDQVVQQRDKLALENSRIEILSDTLSAITNERDKLKVDTGSIPGLKNSLSQTMQERDRLQAENIKIEKINASLDGNLTALDKSLDELEKMLNLQLPKNDNEDRFERLSILTKQRLFLLNSIPNGLPIKAIRVNDGYGMRYHPIKKSRTMHNGIDYKASKGTAVYAPADGVVQAVERRAYSGKYIKIVHNFGFETSYSHLNNYLVKVGEYVHKGQKIAESGNTGRSTGPHLHYELLYLSKAINPEEFVKWNIANFDRIFTKVESVKWASLKNLYPLNQNVQH